MTGGDVDLEIDALPAAIGRYPVMSRLGRGGMGTVYEAYDPRLDRRVAIKVIRRDKKASDRHLRREGQALAALAHPNVVAVFEVGSVPTSSGGGDAVYLAMELVVGSTLREWATRGARTEAEIVAAYVQAGRASPPRTRSASCTATSSPKNASAHFSARRGV